MIGILSLVSGIPLAKATQKVPELTTFEIASPGLKVCYRHYGYWHRPYWHRYGYYHRPYRRYGYYHRPYWRHWG